MANGSTAIDFPEVAVDPKLVAAAKSFDIDIHMVNLLLNEPFFSTICMCLHKQKTEEIPTAGVTVSDLVFTLLWNPMFLASLEPMKIRGLMKHESYHLIFDHCTSRRRDPHTVWNYATDLAINSLISRDELPDCGLYPGVPLDLTKLHAAIMLAKTENDEKRLAHLSEQLGKWTKVSDVIASFPAKQSAEWYMTKLMEDDEIANAIDNKPGPGEPGGDGSGEFSPGELDSHEGWDNLTDEEKNLARGMIRQVIKTAAKKCDQTGQWGSVGADTREEIRKLVNNDVSWESVLRCFCGNSQRAEKRSTRKKINRKYPYIHPGTRRTHRASIWVFVDESGSVGNDELARIFGTLSQLGRLTEFKFFPFDTRVDEKNAVVWKKGKDQPVIRTAGGGTSFHAVEEFMKKNKDKCDAYIIATDGEASDPGPSCKKRAWLLLPGRKLLFDPHPGDVMIKMDKGK
tara:strand:- start:212 stop:1582 length:1371 start_codon:yes stop_codon:yes gene_type:complete